MWKWEWTNIDEESSQHSEAEEDYCKEQQNLYLHSDSETSDSNVEDIPAVTHTVTFKCIGSVHDFEKQLVLSKISKLLWEKKQAEVRIHPEPENPFDANAICFECFIYQKWHIIGYIVRECLQHVHKALKERRIQSNLQTKDTLGTGLLSFLRRLSLSRRFAGVVSCVSVI